MLYVGELGFEGGTVVWSAPGDPLLPNGSVLLLVGTLLGSVHQLLWLARPPFLFFGYALLEIGRPRGFFSKIARARAAGRALLYDRATVAERERYWWARRTERLLRNLQSDDRGIFVEYGSALVADGRTPKRPP